MAIVSRHRGYIYTHSFPYVHTNCLRTLVAVVLANARIIYRYCMEELLFFFSFAYLPAFHVNYSDICSHSVTSFLRKLGRDRKRFPAFTLTFPKKVALGSSWQRKFQLNAVTSLKKPFSPGIIKDRRTRVTMASHGYPCRKGNSAAREDGLLGVRRQ